jgi:hypothetical protein
VGDKRCGAESLGEASIRANLVMLGCMWSRPYSTRNGVGASKKSDCGQILDIIQYHVS